MSDIDNGYYQQDCVFAMAQITVQLASDIGAPTAPQQAVADVASQAIAALNLAGNTPPADLQTVRNAYVQNVRDGYTTAKADIEAKLALPTDVQAALGYDVGRLTVLLATADSWIAAIDAAWTPGA